ncbi:MAG: hypothetical protein P9E88_18705 [Candidatus Competibacter sp.]|jgi:tetratricopeptide (TPR) repeat protein|nr:hypothetical protein [Candidatus Competibacter sp.]
MSADRRSFERLRDHARQARETGDYPQAARLERQATELAGALGLPGQQARALLWEGYSLRQAGEDDLALATLLQVVGERAATADPTDAFGALTTIVHIGLERKPLRFCRALLDQARHYLNEIRQPWTAPLDYLEGELALRRGEFTAAWDWHSRAWAGWRDEYPRLTAPTHLWALCRTAFRRRHLAELERPSNALVELHPNSTLERQLVERARLLSWRAQRATGAAQPAPDPTVPVETALALLASAVGESRDFGARREALRALALANRWDAVDDSLARHELKPDSFDNSLLLGDLALNRARATLGLPMLDGDYGGDGDAASPSPDRLDPESRSKLEQAGSHYRSALALAEAEDERLETQVLGATVRNRLRRLETIALVLPHH